MKSTVLVVSVLAAVAVAQPHGHGHGHQHRRKDHGRFHDKRGTVVEWVTETVYETVTALVDESTTELIMPSTKVTTTSTTSTTSSTSSSTSTSSTTSTSASQSPGVFLEPAKTSSSSVAPTTSTSQPPVVVVPSVSIPPVVVQPSTSIPAPAPAPTPSSSSPPPAQTGGSGGGSGNGGPTYSGDMTYFALGMGSCGIDDSNKDHKENIVAVAASLMGAQSNNNPMCGRTITIKANGRTTTAKVHDKCPVCASGDIDASEKLFLELWDTLEGGRKKVEWWFN